MWDLHSLGRRSSSAYLPNAPLPKLKTIAGLSLDVCVCGSAWWSGVGRRRIFGPIRGWFNYAQRK